MTITTKDIIKLSSNLVATLNNNQEPHYNQFRSQFLAYVKAFEDAGAILLDLQANNASMKEIEDILFALSRAFTEPNLDFNTKNSTGSQKIMDLKGNLADYKTAYYLAKLKAKFSSKKDLSSVFENFMQEIFSLVPNTITLSPITYDGLLNKVLNCYPNNFKKERSISDSLSEVESDFLNTLYNDLSAVKKEENSSIKKIGPEECSHFEKSFEQVQALAFNRLINAYKKVTLQDLITELSDQQTIIDSSEEKYSQIIEKIALYIFELRKTIPQAIKSAAHHDTDSKNMDRALLVWFYTTTKNAHALSFTTAEKLNAVISTLLEYISKKADISPVVEDSIHNFIHCITHLGHVNVAKNNFLKKLAELKTIPEYSDLAKNLEEHFKVELFTGPEFIQWQEEIDNIFLHDIQKTAKSLVEEKLAFRDLIKLDFDKADTELTHTNEYIEIIKTPFLTMTDLVKNLTAIDLNDSDAILLFANSLYKYTALLPTPDSINKEYLNQKNKIDEKIPFLFTHLLESGFNQADLKNLESIQKKLWGFLDTGHNNSISLIENLIGQIKIAKRKENKDENSLTATMNKYLHFTADNKEKYEVVKALKKEYHESLTDVAIELGQSDLAKQKFKTITERIEEIVKDSSDNIKRKDVVISLKNAIFEITTNYRNRKRLGLFAPANTDLANELRIAIEKLAGASNKNSSLDAEDQNLSLLRLRMLFCLNHYLHLCEDRNSKQLLSDITSTLCKNLGISIYSAGQINVTLKKMLQLAPDQHKAVILADEMDRAARQYLKRNSVLDSNRDIAAKIIAVDKNKNPSYDKLLETHIAFRAELIKRDSKKLLHSIDLALNAHRKDPKSKFEIDAEKARDDQYKIPSPRIKF